MARFIQQKAEQSASSVSSFTSTAMVVSGRNAIVACMSASQLTTLVATDSLLNTYVPIVLEASSVHTVAIALANNIIGGSTTYTVTPGVASFCSISAQEYVTASGALLPDVTNNATASSANISPGVVTCTSAVPSLYVACWTYEGTTTTWTFNAANQSWVTRGDLPDGTFMPLGSQDLVAGGAKTGSATLAVSKIWGSAVAVFRDNPAYYNVPRGALRLRA